MRNRTNKKVKRRKRIRLGIRKKIVGTIETPRLSVFKSNKGISGQLIDDINKNTIVSASYLDKDLKAGTKTEVAKQVGLNLAQKAKDNNIEKILFDRNGYLYHGIVKSFGDGAREGGLKF